ncbi:MAG: glycosyltransferase [Gammaproteobacteria bacterium]|nr:glycosyltransferase [Gammaproteobacteria bacterium]MCF6259424.1 glycosyltransferase [Gammaproteobacteria bacterium]
MKRDLIVFAEDWGGLPSSTQHLINHLAKHRKIIWINSIGLRRPNFGWQDIKRALNKLRGKKSICANNGTTDENIKALPNNNFHIIYPRTLPAPRSQLGRWLAAWLLSKQITPVVKKSNLQSPILWISLPTAVDVAGKLGESALVYYCGDDFSALAGVDHDTVTKREKELVEKANLIISASEKLCEKFPPSRSFLLPHGVDYSLFSKPSPRATDLPNDGRPIAGFYGSISSWLDIKMLQTTIEKMPDWHFVFIGKPVIDISKLTHFRNVHMLGEKAHHQLPSYSQHWTASLLPFVDNAQIQSCNPLKLSEYLAAGRPIISTEFPAITPFRGLIQVANNSETMVEALKASQHVGNLPGFPKALRNAISKNSWESRAQQTSQWLETL